MNQNRQCRTTAGPSGQKAALRITNLCKTFGKKEVLKNLNFEVPKGGITGFLGPNGAGKSTTIKIIAGLVAPTSGTVEIEGVPMNGNSSAVFQKLGIMFEAPAFYNYLTARQNFVLLTRLQQNRAVDIDHILKIVGLSGSADVKVGEFSQGMRQRLGIGQALLVQPEFLILDEPTNALDPLGRKEMKNLILHLAQTEKMTIFISSHLLSEIEQICTHAVIIHEGRILAADAINALREHGIQTLEDYFLELIEKENQC
ncbi:MAG: ATP-binding cassette domain-containing protein [Desulfobacteraceae bacterium]|nr:MAG: ATP-binding cassette domain-containing protein [Desulfobacteraceae bacterium]